MIVLIELLRGVYILSALALTVYTSGIWILLVLWGRYRRQSSTPPPVADDAWPTVTVQLPIYNEREVARRLLDAVAALDYPRDRLRIQVLDDSTDDTSALVAALVAGHAQDGLCMTHVQRPTRTEYKAGALAYGLQQTDADLIALFDADFVPPPDFLHRTAPYFVADPGLGLLQARWGHLNARQNLITRSQAISIDGHFVVEQTGRNRGGLLLSFNGTGGIWRRACIDDAGGWSGATLAEDLDLSYRAQLRGWRYLYLPDVEVPAEIPPQVAAYKRQQERWAKGTTQNLLRLVGPVWRSPRLSVFQKVMGTLHLCQYLPQPLLLILAVLTLPLMVAGALDGLPLAPLGLIGLGPPLMYVLSQRHLYRDWPRRLIAFPVLLALGSGVILSNTLAVLGALFHRPGVFKRTPKFADRAWQGSRYALRADWRALVESLLALYMVAGGLLALQRSPGIAPFLFVQATGFLVVALWGVLEGVLLRSS